MEKIDHANTNWKKMGVNISIQSRFQSRKSFKEQERTPLITMSIMQESITILNVFITQIRACEAKTDRIAKRNRWIHYQI